MSLKGLSEKRRQKSHTFNMPDGSVLHNCRDVDMYYNLGLNTTRSRIYIGWTEEECANNRRDIIKYVFHMPDGSVLHNCRDVDRYYNFRNGATSKRLKRGWTEEECANNRRDIIKYVFHMPDGTILNRPVDVDRYYGLKLNTTQNRLRGDWTEEECANNKRVNYKRKIKEHIFNMPDGTVYNTIADVDRYYKLKIGTTSSRLDKGWTEEECANNRRENYKNSKYTFNMPDGSILYSCTDVDRYYNLKNNATFLRLKRGWTNEECVNNEREGGYKRHRFNMPDGSILYSCTDVDRYHNLGLRTTRNRLSNGWTNEECASNKRDGVPKYIFHMPDGTILYRKSHVDKYYNLPSGTTGSRLLRGWTEEECANNKKSI